MKKTLISLLTAGSLLLGSLGIKAQEPFEIGLAPKDTKELIVEDIVFDNLKDATDFTLEPPKENTRIRINAYQGDFRTSPTLIYTLRNRELVGVNPVVPSTKLTAENRGASYLEGSIVNGTIYLDNSKLENLVYFCNENERLFKQSVVFIGENFTGEDIISRNNEVVGNYFIGGECQVSLTFISAVENNTIRDNIFDGASFAGIGWGYFKDSPREGELIIRDNLFINNSRGVHAQGYASFNLGTEEDRGENIFIKNDWNLDVYLSSGTLPAQFDYWLDNKGNPLTSEDAIYETILVRNPSSAMQIFRDEIKEEKPIKVLPCHTEPPYEYSCPVGSWVGYR